MSIKTYEELSKLGTFEERYEYLRIGGGIGIETFGFDRYLNQVLYQSSPWKNARQRVIIRDNGCDLGIYPRQIPGRIIIHHLNPITEDDIVKRNPIIFDLNNLICCSITTHNAIHYGDESLLMHDPIERRKNDTCPWKEVKND